MGSVFLTCSNISSGIEGTGIDDTFPTNCTFWMMIRRRDERNKKVKYVIYTLWGTQQPTKDGSE
jgi:hypothetical protein